MGPLHLALISLSLLLWPAFGGPGGLQAAGESGLSLEATSAWQGLYAEGHWLPIWVDASNSGRGAEVELRATTARASYAVAVELPAGSEKRVPLLVWLDASDRGSESLRLEAVDEDGDILASAELPLQALGRSRLVTVLRADGSQLPAGLETDSRHGRAIAVRPELLPESALGWSSVDRAVLTAETYRRLSSAQGEALRRWVGLGGHLLLAGGPDGQGLLDALPDVMRPAAAGEVLTLTRLPSLAALAGRAGPRGRLRLLELEAAEDSAHALTTEDGLPLALHRSYGDGVVTALAFDPLEDPFVAWPGLAAVWSAVEVSRPGTAWSEDPPDAAWMATGIRGERGLPPMAWAALIILLYIVLVGPVNYRILSRRRRLDLAWLTIPLLSFMASVAMYGIGMSVQGRAPSQHQLSVVRVVPEAGLAKVTGFVGIWAPSARDYALEISAGHARYDAGASEASPRLDVIETAEGQIVDLPAVPQAELGGFLIDAVIPWPAQAASPALILRDGRVRGRVVNSLGVDLRAAQLLTPGGRGRLNSLPDGGSSSIDAHYAPGRPLELDARGPEGHLMASLLAGGMQPASSFAAAFPVADFVRPEAVLVGFADSLPFGVEMSRRSVAGQLATLVYGHVPIGLDSSMRFVDGLATRRSSESAGRCGPAAAVLAPDYDFAEFAFPLGEGKPLPYAAWLALIGPGAEAMAAEGVASDRPLLVELALWDPDERAWLDFAMLQAGGSIDIPRLITRVEGRDQIRLRLSLDAAADLVAWEAMRDYCWEPRLSIVEGAGENDG